MRTGMLLLTLLALAACNRGSDEPSPTGVSAEEAKSLDEAAAMVESGRPAAPSANPPTAPLPPTAPSAAASETRQ
jgi:hypothetical protein